MPMPEEKASSRHGAGQCLGPVLMLALFVSQHPRGLKVFVPKLRHALIVWGLVFLVLLMAAMSGAGA